MCNEEFAVLLLWRSPLRPPKRKPIGVFRRRWKTRRITSVVMLSYTPLKTNVFLIRQKTTWNSPCIAQVLDYEEIAVSISTNTNMINTCINNDIYVLKFLKLKKIILSYNFMYLFIFLNCFYLYDINYKALR